MHLEENTDVLEQIAQRLQETKSFRRGSLLSDEIEQALGIYGHCCAINWSPVNWMKPSSGRLPIFLMMQYGK